ncbi:nucleotidyltransferase family protein [Granulicella tundricola]|uniref:4-diphosphocytidyl-2C-methyl-D-erythritol synthase n=1 Tax=Granulicella tundricola (strain ATCC BAA-1859 / DSM 23138 / MP5ACTX9) TaxID=1198114 RepID=E8WYZ7_GRATM|nr:nucleotidyltransferase family protein [Granulicella tundricola]ADW69912.1 4-diphosphocytidyl-2C-methyl-D-erythritol synthase [Granulicella tundricola MP5ACTX9]
MNGVVAIILAAGASTRMGSPKQIALLNGEPLLSRAVRTALEAECTPLVVLGANAEEVAAVCDLASAQTVFNPQWESGMAASIAVGIRKASETYYAAIIMTCDQPSVTPAHLRQLIHKGERLGRPIASAYAGRKGVPAFFPADHFALLACLSGDLGARDLLAEAQAIDLPLGELDIDTPEKLIQAQRVFVTART